MKYLGDVSPAVTVGFEFTTEINGALSAAVGLAVSIRRLGSTTPITSGVALSTDYASTVGLHYVAVDLSASGSYSSGSDFQAYVSAGTVGGVSQVGRLLDSWSIGNRSTAAIKAKTDNLPADPADASDVAGALATISTTLATIAGYIDTEVAAIKAKTDNLPGDPADASDVAASFTSLAATLATLSGYVDTEVAAIKAVTDLFVSAQAEPAGVVLANGTPLEKLAFVFALARNKQTLNKDTNLAILRNDGDSANIASRTDSDDGTTYTKGKYV